MLELLVVLSIVEAVLVLVVLAIYLLLVMRSLRSSAKHFAKVAFGVRAIETQAGRIGPAVTDINRRLEELGAALPPIVRRAERVARSRSGPSPGARRSR